jgi:hypothetical protein
VKIAKKFAVAAVAGVLTIGGAASAFAAGGGTSSATGAGGTGAGKAAAKAFICAHLDQVQAQEKLKEELLSGRLTLLQEAKDAATTANKPKLVARIDARITKNGTETTKLQAREAKVVAACAAPAATAPAPTTTAAAG